MSSQRSPDCTGGSQGWPGTAPPCTDGEPLSWTGAQSPLGEPDGEAPSSGIRPPAMSRLPCLCA